MDVVGDVDMVTNYSDRDSEDAERVDPFEHGRQVYRQVWKEFYSWKTQSSRSILDSLRVTDITASIPDSTVNYRDCDRRDPHPTGSPEDECVILTFDEDGVPNKEVTYLREVTVNFRRLPSIPEYTSCTPLGRNYSCDLDSSDDPERASFLPFADDPNFSLPKYLESFVYGVQWQKKQAPVDLDDPDLEMIDAEVARRLVFQPADRPEFSFVDQMHLFLARDRFSFEGEEADFLNLRQKNKSGLIWLSKQRDQLTWPRIPDEELEDFGSTYIPEDSTLFEDINRGAAQFCGHINCITHFCTVHGYERPPLTPSRPYKTNAEMQLAEGHPCGPLCFRNLLATGQSLETFYFDSETASVISSVLDITPDIEPCNLSVICRLPCREVFAFRVQKYSDPAVFQSIDDEVPKSCTIAANAEHWTPRTAPCMCIGEVSCQENQDCTCKKDGLFCERNCLCRSQCARRFLGCECKDGCNTEACACVSGRRECDPEKCLKCNARGDDSIPLKYRECRNVGLQRPKFALVEIKHSEHGWGAFAGQHIRRRQLIGEYCGEIIGRRTAFKNRPVERYLQKNYNYDMPETGHPQSTSLRKALEDETGIINAHMAGNETRYLNDAKNVNEESKCEDASEKYNCEALGRVVNGEPRLGIIATRNIKKGEELFLDYGEGYWIND